MVRFLLCGAVLAAAALPAAASAQLGEKLDCAADKAEPGFKQLFADALIGDGDNSAFERLMAQFSVVADGCTAGFALDAAQKKAYLDYGVSGILHEWLTARLASHGLSASIIDKALDFGPGRINPALSGGMDEAHVQILVQAFMESGIDTESLSPSAWETVGTYAALSSIYWRQRLQLSLWTVKVIPTPVVAGAATPGPAAPEPPPEPAVAAPPPVETVPAPAPEPAIAAPPPAEAVPAPVPEPTPEPAIVAPPPAETVPAPAPEPAPEPEPVISAPPPAEASPAPVPEPKPEPAIAVPPPAEADPAPSPEPAPSAEVRSSPGR